VKYLLSIPALALALAPLAASAQTAPDGAAPTAPGSTAPSAAPAPAPAAPAPDQAAKTTPAQPDQKPLMWRGTTFTFTQSVSSTTLGIGRDNIGYEDDQYGLDFVLSPQLYLLDLEKDKIFVFAEAGVTVELTDSGSTTTRNEPQFRDTQVGVGYNRTLWASQDKEWSTGLGTKVRYNIPTSKPSLEQGRYGVLSASASLTQKIRLLGEGAAGLNNLTLTGGLTYSHLFAKSYEPVNGDLERTRQNASGASIFSDQLSFRSMDMDRLIPSAIIILPLYKDLSLTTQFRLIGRFKHDFESKDCEVVVMGECTTAGRQADRVTYVTDSTFDISLSQPIYDMFQINIGYNNENLTLSEDSKTRNPFYSPNAQFYLDLVANIDEIYTKASGRSKFDLPPGPRNNLPVAGNEYGMPSF